MADLCTRADVRAELEMGTTETGRDARIDALLPVATSLITRWCSREFVNAFPGSDATPRKFAYYGGSRVNLAPYDLQSASVVAIDTDGASPVTLVVSADYYLEPLPNPDGVFTHLLIPGLQPADNGLIARREVSITGVWGFPAVPADAKRAAVISIAGWLDKAVSEYAGQADGDARQLSPASGAGYSLSRDAKIILGDLRRRGIA